jgi:hypothetical protein
MHNKVYLFVAQGADSILLSVPSYIRLNQSDTDLSFESCAYDAILRTLSELQKEGINQLASEIQGVLPFFQKRHGTLLPVEIQEDMKNYKNQLSFYLQRITCFRHLVEDLIADEEEMVLMHVSLFWNHIEYYQLPLSPIILQHHEVIEELLETHLIDFSSLEMKAQNTLSDIDRSEELVSEFSCFFFSSSFI